MLLSRAPLVSRPATIESGSRTQAAREAFWRQPVAPALVFFALLTMGLGLWAWRACDGLWTYAFDDAYIHLAIAHNLSFHGVWGVSASAFASASSSPLWTVLLALVLRAWNSDLAPLVLNALFGAGTLIVAARVWKGWNIAGFSPALQSAGLCALCLVTPLPLLCFIGMEHTMHACLALAFLGAASRVIGEGRSAKALPLLAFGMSGARLEGVFLVGFVALYLFKGKRFGSATAILGAALLPFALHGVMAHAQGWPFVAASIALKSPKPEASLVGAANFLVGIIGKWVAAWPCTLMAILALALAPEATTLQASASPGDTTISSQALARATTPETSASVTLCVALRLFGATALCHVALAAVSSFFRYEAYLFALGVLTLWPALLVALPRERVFRALPLQLLALCVGLGWALRSGVALRDGAPASRNIYRQQRQMARFIGEFYPRETVALNDIGTTDWAAANRPDGHAALDLVGLSDQAIMEARLRTPRYALLAPFAQHLLQKRRVRVALIYDDWFRPRLLDASWTRVARLDSGPKIVSGARAVSFWTKRDNATNLRAQLSQFQKQLPQGDQLLWN